MVLWTLFHTQRKIIKDNELGKKGHQQGSERKMMLVVTGKLNWSWRKRKLEASQQPRRSSEWRKWSNKSSYTTVKVDTNV